MTSLTPQTPMTLPVAMKPITLAEGIAAGLATSALVLYAWTAHTSAGACWFKPLGCIAGDDAWARQVVLSVGLNFAVWLYSLRTLGSLGRSDSSIVDKLWSLTPVLACWHWLCCADPSSPGYPRLLLMTALCTAWGARLTANFARKGGFSGGEDYRWAVLRGWFGAADEGRISAEWELFNLVFICQAQQLVILAFTSPAAAAMLAPDIPINAVDVLAACGFVAALVGETIADEQMLAFQTEKYRRLRSGLPPLGTPFEHGFIRHGMWALSRHPNYFCEVTLWWMFYAFSVGAGCGLVNWTLPGPALLSCLFLAPRASLDLAEAISTAKYPGYLRHAAAVSRFVPWPPQREGTPPLGWGDRALVGWFVMGLVITFTVDMEQVMISDPIAYAAADPPARVPWPPAACVDAIHWWGRTADKLVIARPVWFRVGIWIEILVQAPCYAVLLAGFSRSRRWVRLPSLIYATVLLTIMPIVMAEQYFGEHATDTPLLVTAPYAPYALVPLLLLLRVRHPDVFPGAPADPPDPPPLKPLPPNVPTIPLDAQSGASSSALGLPRPVRSPRLKSVAPPASSSRLHYRSTAQEADRDAGARPPPRAARSPARRRAS